MKKIFWRKILPRVIGPFVLLFLTVSSLGVATYAWFVMAQKATVSVSGLTVENNDFSAQLYYYSGNYDETTSQFVGYKDIRTIAEASRDTEAKKITDYSAQFVAVSNNTWTDGGPMDMVGLLPGVCCTYALEITASKTKATNFSLILSSFSSDPSADRLIYDGGTTSRGITLANAIDIYSEGFIKSSDNTQNTAEANTFITTFMTNGPTDKFAYDDANTENPTSYSLFQGILPAGNAYIVLFTIEFSNENSTFYLYKEKIGNDYYFERSVDGSSTAYEDLPFTIQNLAVRKN